MLLWSVLVDRDYRSPDTGLDYAGPRPRAEALATTSVKIVGLWGTWLVIGALYFVLREYEQEKFRLFFAALLALAPFLLVLSVPYIHFVDRRMREPHDTLWHAGQWFLRRPHDPAMVLEHARCWAIKGFFLALMVAGLPYQVHYVTGAGWGAVFAGGVDFIRWLIGVVFLVDLSFAVVGYVFTSRLFDAHIRTANPFAMAWIVALICYPPFILMGGNGPLNYRDGMSWLDWLDGRPLVADVWGAMILVLAIIYGWATVAFGLRFSNLTHRGILTNGPYRFFKHPAYLAKNLFWWLVFMPFVSTEGPLEALRNSALLLIVNLVYWLRAKSEEWHLMQDPAYRAYCAWMAEHGLLARLRRGLIALLTGR